MTLHVPVTETSIIVSQGPTYLYSVFLDDLLLIPPTVLSCFVAAELNPPMHTSPQIFLCRRGWVELLYRGYASPQAPALLEN